MSAWSVKTRRAHCRDARVNGLKTTDMDEISAPPCSSAGYTGWRVKPMRKLRLSEK